MLLASRDCQHPTLRMRMRNISEIDVFISPILLATSTGTPVRGGEREIAGLGVLVELFAFPNDCEMCPRRKT